MLMLPAGLASAQSFSSSRLQLLYGTGFEDWYYGNNTIDERQTTLTFEHFTAFGVGDVFFFADLMQGTFAGVDDAALGQDYRIYSELAVRVSPFRLAGRPLTGLGPVQDVLLAAQVNRDGGGFAANLVGVGTNWQIPGFAVASVAVYYRDDLFNEPTYQVTTVWNVPVRLGAVQASFGGFLDVYGTDTDGADVHAQPQLLIGPVDAPFSAGVELYIHRNRSLEVFAPQLLVEWRP